jgi:hypothetical protein
LNAVGVGVSIVADTGHLPGNFSAGLAASDLETVSRNLPSNIQIGLRSAE